MTVFEDMQSRLNRIRSSCFTYKIKDKTFIDEEKYILTFAKTMNVKTLRTPNQTDKPQMYIYGNGYFEKGAETYFKETNYQLFGSLMNRHLNSDLTQMLQAWTYVDSNYFDTINPDYLNLQNCVINLKTGEKVDYHPDFKMTTVLPIVYDVDADYSFFEEFVSQIVEKSNAKVIQEMFGYCLYRDYYIQKAFMLTGRGANGKGVLLHCLKEMLGEKNCSSVNLVSLNNNRFMSAQLHHKYANISNETPSSKLSSTETFKSLRGGDLIPAENKFGQPFNFVNYAKMIFAANKIPTTPDYTYAFWRSWILIKFPHIFEGEGCNKNLKYELTTPERLSGILNYSIEGLKRLFEQHDFSYSKTTEDVQEEWKRSADSTLVFILTEVVEDEKGEVLTNAILSSYFNYCLKYNLKPESELGFWKRWNKHMKEYFPKVEKKQYSVSKKYYWKGIKLVDEPDD